MCRPGNQSITKECWDELVRITGRQSLSNQEARQLLKEKDGCLKLDATKLVMSK